MSDNTTEGSAAADRGLRLRPLREDDAVAVAELYQVAFGDLRPIDAAEIVSWFRNPELHTDWLQVAELDGRLVGYGDIWIDGDDLALEIAAPGCWDTFFDWAESVGRRDRLGRVRVLLPAGHEAEGIAKRRGYHLWRSSYTMHADLDNLPQVTNPPPAGIAIRGYQPEDAEPLRAALNEAFAGGPFYHQATPSNFAEFYLGAVGFDPSLFLLAWDGGELAGFALAFPHSPGEPDLGWIGNLGVRPPWRRRGLGETLLRAALEQLRRRGVSRAGLGVDAENATGALRLYRRAGLRVVRQGNNWAMQPPR
jgi:ribosomal protein S18 acetylase RimI-like enzyme